MKELTAIRFLQIILEDNPELHFIIGNEISYLKAQLENYAIQPELSLSEFHAVARQYPNYVQVTETSVIIHDGGELKNVLKHKLIFSQDKELDDNIIEIWKRLKES